MLGELRQNEHGHRALQPAGSLLIPTVHYHDIKSKLEFYGCYRFGSRSDFSYKASHNGVSKRFGPA